MAVKQGASRRAVEQAVSVVMDLRRRFREQDRPDKVKVDRGELMKLVEALPADKVSAWNDEVKRRAQKSG